MGSLVNVYGPNGFPQKSDFMHFLQWLGGSSLEGNWIIGVHFNLIASLRENKGGRPVMDRFQEELREIGFPS